MRFNVPAAVFCCFVLHILFYLWSIESYGIIYGMSDVDNYFRLSRGEEFENLYNIRHLLMAQFAKNQIFLAFIMPFIFWYGCVYLYWLRAGDDVFILFFGTAAFWLFTVIGLWGQFLCIALFQTAVWFWNYNPYGVLINTVAAVLCVFLALVYFPVWWYLFGLVAPFEAFIFASLGLVSVDSFQFFKYPSPWHPVLTFLLLFCPALIAAGYKQRIWDKRIWAQFFVYGVQYLARMTVFMYFFIDYPKISRAERVVYVLWWIVLGVYFLRLWYLDASCADGLECRVGLLIKNV